MTMPAFRKPQIDKRIEDAVYHTRSLVASTIIGIYNEGFSDGQSHERRRLIERLRQYEKDSVVATLLAEMMVREEQES